MKILLDECVPWPLHRLLSGHECATAQRQGWGGLKNGELLQKAEAGFELFITSDQNFRYQQNLSGRRVAILELSTNDIGRDPGQDAASRRVRTTALQRRYGRHGRIGPMTRMALGSTRKTDSQSHAR